MSGRLTGIVVVGLLVAAVTVRTAHAQRPERQQDVRAPISGLGVALKPGWQLRFYNGCRFAVPGTWRQDADGSAAIAPDGSNLSVRMLRITNWSAHKTLIRAAFGHVNILHEDSDRRLWFEIGDKTRTQHYIDVVNGQSACAGLLEIRTETTPDPNDTATRIADSLGPAPDRVSPDSR